MIPVSRDQHSLFAVSFTSEAALKAEASGRALTMRGDGGGGSFCA